MLLPEDFPWGWDSGVGKLCDVAIPTRLHEKKNINMCEEMYLMLEMNFTLFQSPVPEGQCTMKVV